MSLNQMLRCVVLSGTLIALPIQAQDQLQRWQTVSGKDSGLVFFIETPVVTFSLRAGDKELDFVKWDPALPFVKQYRMEPGVYEILLAAEPISGLRVRTREGALTFLRFLPNEFKTIQVGGWFGAMPPAQLARILSEASARRLGDVFATPHIDGTARTLYVNTQPPWPIPPPPPPR
jgi:hypothetical protein